MSIDKDLEAYDELCDELAYVGSRKFDQGLVADAIVALIDAKLDARLSPAPVGGETDDGCGCRKCIEAHEGWQALAGRMVTCPRCGNKRCPKADNHDLKCTGSNALGQIGVLEDVAPTPPPAEPDGGDGVVARVLEGAQTAVRSGIPIQSDADDVLAALQAQAATIAERDRRIAELEAGLKPFAEAAEGYDPDEGDGAQVAWAHDFTIASLRRARALLTPATDKGGE